MAVANGFNVTIKLVSGGTCACSGDVTTLTGGTCTPIPYLDSYSNKWDRAMIDVTGFGDKVTKVQPGIATGTLDFSGGLDLTNAPQKAFYDSMACSSPAQRMVRVYDGGKNSTIKGYCTGVQLGGSPTAKSTFSASISATQLPKTC